MKIVFFIGVKITCEFCDYKTRNKSDLNRHKRSKHSDIELPCDQCDYTATQQTQLTLHKR